MTLTNKFQQARPARTILSHGKTVTKKFKNVFVSMHGNMQQNSPRIPSVTIRFSRAKRTAVQAICNGGADIAFISRQFYCKAPYSAKKQNVENCNETGEHNVQSGNDWRFHNCCCPPEHIRCPKPTRESQIPRHLLILSGADR